MSTGHPVLADFQAACQKYYACLVLANKGIHQSAQEMSSAPAPPEARVFFSEVDPTKQRATATIKKTDLLAFSANDGHFADTLSKAMLVTLYAEWDEYFRPKFAGSIGVPSGKVRCNLLGDLRHIRNCIVHAKSVVTTEHLKLKELKWRIAPGPLLISAQMMREFIEQTHSLAVYIEN